MGELTQDYLISILEYDDEDGTFRWRSREDRSARWNTRFSGKLAGYRESTFGYIQIEINNKMYKAHRLAWLYKFGEIPQEIDHIDGNPSNNRIENLRNVNHAENMKNLKRSGSNTSGVTGVSFDKINKNWRVSITVDGKMKNLGRYENFDEAVLVRKQAEVTNDFHVNHGREAA